MASQSIKTYDIDGNPCKFYMENSIRGNSTEFPLYMRIIEEPGYKEELVNLVKYSLQLTSSTALTGVSIWYYMKTKMEIPIDPVNSLVNIGSSFGMVMGIERTCKNLGKITTVFKNIIFKICTNPSKNSRNKVRRETLI